MAKNIDRQIQKIKDDVEKMGGIDGPQMPHTSDEFNKILEKVLGGECSIYYIPPAFRKKVSELLVF